MLIKVVTKTVSRFWTKRLKKTSIMTVNRRYENQNDLKKWIDFLCNETTKEFALFELILKNLLV